MKLRKTILAAALATAMVASLGTTAFAENEAKTEDSTTLTYKVTGGYIWSVPSKIDFGADVQEETITIPSSGESDNKVEVTKNIINEGEKLVIKIADDQNFEIKTGTNTTLDYKVSKETDGNDVVLEKGDEIISLTAGTNTGHVALKFELETKLGSQTAGEYSGTLKYVASVEPKPNT